MPNKEDLIVLTGDDGKNTNCVLFDMVEYSGRYYALLVEATHVDDDEPELIIMRYRDLGNDVMFESITDKTEFDEVSKFVEELPNSEE